jgi:hypothetical protein
MRDGCGLRPTLLSCAQVAALEGVGRAAPSARINANASVDDLKLAVSRR